MTKVYRFFNLLLSIALYSGTILGQCTTCEPDYACTSPDGMPVLCPNSLPDAVTGEYYNTTATFYMPSSIVDPGSGIDASLLSVTLSSMTGVPFGLDIVPNNPGWVYYPSSGEEYGCVIICGTPLVAGEYYININVSVLVSAFGFEQTIYESFSLPFTVLQGEQGNASFSASTTSGCAPLEVQLTNSITGPGTSYEWDLGGLGSGTELTMNLTTDNFGLETTWNITDESGTIIIDGGPYEEGVQTNYLSTACIGNGCYYTLNVFDSYGDGMQYGGVVGNYTLTDGNGNLLAQIVDGGNFGAQATHTFCVFSDTPSGCTQTSANPTVIFEEPGTYQIGLVTTVTELTMIGLDIITLSGGWSGDVEETIFWGDPDPYFTMTGEGVGFVSGWIGETETPNFTGLSIPLQYGTQYDVSFYDEDDVSANDYLGTATFVPSAPGEFMINGGGNTAIITIIESVSAVFEDTETIVVYDTIDAYADYDGDGFGDGELPVNGCDTDLTTPYAFNGEDCNDSDAAMYPGALGTFSNIDNDCNTVIEDDELPAVEGCMDIDACNYNEEANVEDGSCEYTSCIGCTDPIAINYDPTASIPDDSCEYSVCFADFNNDGAITVTDLLILLASFGCEVDCETDLSNDDIVSVADLLEILAVFGTICE